MGAFSKSERWGAKMAQNNRTFDCQGFHLLTSRRNRKHHLPHGQKEGFGRSSKRKEGAKASWRHVRLAHELLDFLGEIPHSAQSTVHLLALRP